MLQPIPTLVDVVGFPLDVEQKPQSSITRKMGRTESGGPYVGYLEPHERIVICKDAPLVLQWEILIHEIGHEIQFIIADCLMLDNCDIAMEVIHSLYHRLLTGVLLTNGIIGE